MECRKNYHLSQAHHLSDTFLLGNHLERVQSTNEFYYSEVFLHPFTTVKAFYQRQIPNVTTANDNFSFFPLPLYFLHHNFLSFFLP